jgi:hypothetical protein
VQYNRLWILVEGNDDEKLVEKIKHVFEKKYEFVQIWKYAQEPHKKTRGFLNSINSMRSDCFFLRDINQSLCITARKEGVRNTYGEIVDPNKIIVVIKEIESWYLAGLDDNNCKELGLGAFGRTDEITKEQFDSLIPKRFDSRIDFMQEILKRFSIETAKEKNASFDYFMSKI